MKNSGPDHLELRTMSTTLSTGLLSLTTVPAVLLGTYFGYTTAGIGGAVLYAGLIGMGGFLAGRLIARTLLLFRASWKAIAVTAMLLVIAALTWEMYL
jgi:hypothetical protein